MTSKLYWKELTEDGLLKEPKPVGPYYSPETLNQYQGFETKEEAIKHLESLTETYKYEIPSDLVLVKVYFR